MADDIKITGLDGVLARLQELPETVARRAMRYGLRQGGKVIADLARAGAAKVDDPKTPEDIEKNIAVRNYPKSSEASFGGPAAAVGVLGGARQYADTTRNRRKRRVGEEYATGGSSGNPGGDTWYWRLLEFGTSKMHARPFMRPAMNQGAESALQQVADSLNKALDRVAAKAKK